MAEPYAILDMALDELVPDPENPMAHSDAEVQRLVDGANEYGFLQPVVWNKRTGHVVGGHARVEAARASGLESVPTVVVDFDETREAAANLALNGNYGHWDDDVLSRVLQELSEAHYDLDLTGLEPWKVEQLLGTALAEQDPTALWQGMPEFEQEAQDPVKHITVSFFSEDAVAEFSRLIGQTVTMGTKGIAFPSARADFHSSAYVSSHEDE